MNEKRHLNRLESCKRWWIPSPVCFGKKTRFVISPKQNKKKSIPTDKRRANERERKSQRHRNRELRSHGYKYMQIESYIVLRSGRRRGPGWRPVPARARGEKTLPFYLSSPPSPCPSHRFPSRRMMVQEREREREEVCVKERRERGATERSEGDGRGGTFFRRK